MYRLLIETLLGVNLVGDQLRLNPLLPKDWPRYKVHYRYRRTTYHISISRLDPEATGGTLLLLDGEKNVGPTIPLHDDCKAHTVEMKVR